MEININDGNEIMNKMMSVLNWNISYRQRKNKQKSIKFSINSRLLVDHFITYEYDNKSKVSPNKILNIIPENNKKFFFLGLSDADGCFYVNIKNSVYQYSIASSYDQDWSHMINLFNQLNIKYSIKRSERRINNGTFSKYSHIRITNKKDIIKFGEYIYSNEFKGLNRKYKKYTKIKNII